MHLISFQTALAVEMPEALDLGLTIHPHPTLGEHDGSSQASLGEAIHV